MSTDMDATAKVLGEALEAETPVDEAAVESAAQKALENLSVEDQAAATFRYGIPEYKRLCENMTKNELRRVMSALGEAPLNEEKFRFMNQIEADSFKLGMALMNAKFIMFQAAIAEQMLKDREKEVAEQPVTDNNEEKKEQDNG